MNRNLRNMIQKYNTAMKIAGYYLFKLPVQIKKILFYGKRYYCPVCRSHVLLFLSSGAITRKKALCPICGALERHRLEWIFLETRTNLFDGTPKTMLHVAPEHAFKLKLQEISDLKYMTADLNDPSAMLRMDITDIKSTDDYFDIIYCCHVLEHILEDRKAMSELFRVLKPGGWAVLLVPMQTRQTIEDSNITSPEEREALFGGADHVRAYGPDYVNRLEEAGFDVKVFSAEEVVGLNSMQKMGIKCDQKIFFCVKHYQKDQPRRGCEQQSSG